MAVSTSTTVVPLAHYQPREMPFSMMIKPWNGEARLNTFRSTIRKRRKILGRKTSCLHCTSSLFETGASTSLELHGDFSLPVAKVLEMEETRGTVMSIVQGMVLGDIDPATAKVAISVLGPILSAFSFLFIIRIVMSWYPKLPVDKFPYVVAYAPTEPLLVATRKVIPPLGGVDVTPVVWFGLLSFANEILVGPQGLLVLLSQQV
ncbi:hypothetical protein QQ045_018057 [Rhodiola kirilowii]